MDTDMRAIAEEAARLLLQHFREQHKYWQEDKTPLDELVAWLGCHVETFHPEDEPDGTYGYVDPDEDERLIWLRRNLPETLRRFTLAHELGHVILHCRGSQRAGYLPAGLDTLLAAWDEQPVPELSHADPCHDNDVQESTTGLIDQEQFQNALGIGQQYDPRSQREIAANIFAAELLMPLELVHARYLEQSPASLAGTFVVSNAAMLNRLAGMLKTPATSAPEPCEAQPEAASKRPTAQKQYDEFQRAAIEAPTPALIVAGPGSGKTSTLIGRTEYIIRALDVPAQCILALTFSRKAAQEMEERLQQVLGEGDSIGSSIQALYSLPKVSTFHAFCADILRQYGTLVGLREDFTLIDEAEGYFLLRQMSNAMHLRHYQKLQSPAYYFPDILKAISRAKDELVSPEEYAQLAQRMLQP